MEPKPIQLSMPANLDFSGAVRQFSSAVFKVSGFSDAWCARLQLVVDELFMNAVLYGSNESSHLYITFFCNEEGVHFSIEDEGTGQKKISVDELKQIIETNKANTSKTRTSGRGLAVITNLWTDQMRIEQSNYGGILAGFYKKMDHSTPPSLPMNESPSKNIAVAPTMAPLPEAETAAPLRIEPKSDSPVVEITNGTDHAEIENVALLVKEKMDLLSSGGVLVLDFAKADFINSTFIGYLASWYNDSETKQTQLVIKNANDPIKDVLALVGLNKILSLDN